MKTKEKILHTALQLFNQQGIHKVTLRHIAEEMGISYGNLRYHYRTREDVYLALFEQMMGEISRNFEKALSEEVSMKMLFESHRIFFETQFTYRFFFIYLVDLMRTVAPIREQYTQFDQGARANYLVLINRFVECDLIRPPLFEGQYAKMQAISGIISNYWLSDAEVFFQGKPEDRLNYYIEASCSLVIPLLTEWGWQEYQKYAGDYYGFC